MSTPSSNFTHGTEHPLTLPPEALLNTALEHHQAGRLAEAEHLYQTMLQQNPQQADALHWLGVIAQQRGQLTQAIDLITQALALRPGYAEAHYNLGFAHQSLGQQEQAAACFQRCVTFKADFAEAYGCLGNILKQQGLLEAAVARYHQALTFKPTYVEAHNNLGNSLRLLGRLEEAVASFRNALQIKPDAADVLNNLGVTYQELGQQSAAAACFLQAIALKPDYVEVHNNLGSCYQALGKFDEAVTAFQNAIRFKPDFVNAHHNLGLLYRKRGNMPAALSCFQQALTLRPDFAEASYHVHDLQLSSCYWAHYAENVARINQAAKTGLGRYLPFAFLAVAESPQTELACARTYATEHFPAASQPVWTGQRYSHDKIRVAYLSADFHDHATAYLMAGLFEAHNRQRFEITAISFGPDSQGDMRQRLKPAFDRFLEVRQRGDREIALLLRQLEIDIAVDLKGYTTEGRPGILAHRSAPIQVNYLGYPGSMGTDYLDYILADATVIPPEEQCFYTEKVVYLPETYQVTDNKRRIAERVPSRSELKLPENGFVFCCFNNNYKVTPTVFDSWMRLLQQVEGSVLWLFENNPLVAKNLRQEAEHRGVAPERLVFAPPIKQADHLARLARADLFLDTLPYNAHTTASDALWAGLPVLTRTGNTFAGRVAASLLAAMDLPELITTTVEDYEAKALQLATQPEAMNALRSRLAANRLTTPLFATDRFCRHLESAYELMWQRYQHGLSAEHFRVPLLS